MVGDAWRLQITGGGREVSLTRGELLAMPQRAERLPIACVEGWSTTQDWSGVRLSDLAALVGRELVCDVAKLLGHHDLTSGDIGT